MRQRMADGLGKGSTLPSVESLNSSDMCLSPGRLLVVSRQCEVPLASSKLILWMNANSSNMCGAAELLLTGTDQ